MIAEINEIAVGPATVVLITILHATFVVGGMRAGEWYRAHFGRVQHHSAKAFAISVLSVWMLLAIVIETWLWAPISLFHPMITNIRTRKRRGDGQWHEPGELIRYHLDKRQSLYPEDRA